MNNNNPPVSVILPVYNGEKYLITAIKSVLCQTYRNIELIIIDDASADSSRDIIADTAKTDPRVVIYHNTQNLGLTDTLNIGIKSAKGEFILWLGQDDILDLPAIEKLVTFLCDNPQFSVVYGNYIVISPDGGILANCARAGYIDDPSTLLDGNKAGGSGNALYRSELFMRIGYYYKDAHPCEDYEFLMRAVRCGSIARYPTDDVFFYKRQHPECLSVIHYERQIDKLTEIRNFYMIVFLFEWLDRIGKIKSKRIILLTNTAAGEYIKGFIKEHLKGYTLIKYTEPEDPNAKRRITALPDSMVALTDYKWEGFVNNLPAEIQIDRTYPLINTKFNKKSEAAKCILIRRSDTKEHI